MFFAVQLFFKTLQIRIRPFSTTLFTGLAMTALLMTPFLLQPLLNASSPGNEEQEITALLTDQARSWNEGDLEAFMQGYWDSEELTFYSGAQVFQGRQNTYERYRNRYQSDGREMGHLKFSDLKIELLGAESAFVRGRFHLQLGDGSDATGIFTLVLRKFAGGWKIVHDHTSS